MVVATLSRVCTVSVVREELEHGVDDHPYLQAALDALDDEIPIVTVSDPVANREAVVSDHLDPGMATRTDQFTTDSSRFPANLVVDFCKWNEMHRYGYTPIER